MTAAPCSVSSEWDVEESPDTAGQDAPAREAAKADGQWHRKQTADGVFSGDAAGKGETVG